MNVKADRKPSAAGIEKKILELHAPDKASLRAAKKRVFAKHSALLRKLAQS
jgi:hypothetical protein